MTYEDIIWVIFVMLVVWAIICTRRTAKQKGALIEALAMVERLRIRAGLEHNQAFLLSAQRVGFGKHFWHLFTFRNAAGLYDRK